MSGLRVIGKPLYHDHRRNTGERHSDLYGHAPRQLLGKRKTIAPNHISGRRTAMRKDNYSAPGPIESAPFTDHPRVFKRTGRVARKYAKMQYPALTPYQANRRWADKVPSTDSTQISLPLEAHIESARQRRLAVWNKETPYPRSGTPEEDFPPIRAPLDTYIDRAARRLQSRPPPPRRLMKYSTDVSEDMDELAARQGVRDRWLSEARHFLPNEFLYEGKVDAKESIHPKPDDPPIGGFNFRKLFCCLQINFD